MPNLSDILQSLPHLTNAERRQVVVRLAALDSLNGSPTSGNSEADEVLQALCAFMRASGFESPYPAMLLRSPQYKSFAEKCPAVIQYFSSLNKVERGMLLHIGIGLLYKNLGDMGVAVSIRTLMSHIHRLPACLNKAFPGYAKGGHLKLVVRKRYGQCKVVI